MIRNATGVLLGMAGLACVAGMLVGGCAAPDEPSSAVAGARPASDPGPGDVGRSLLDLGGVDAFVAAQIRDRFAAMQTTIQMADATPGVRSLAYGEMGKLLMAAGLAEAAEPYLLEAQSLVAGDMRWPYYLGHLYRTLGDLARAATSFERALQLRPDDPVTLVSLGEVYLTQGRPEAAEPLFTMQLSRQPDSVVANYGLGRAALARNDYERAVSHLEAALAGSGDTAVGVHYPLALAYRALGDADRAEAHMARRSDVDLLPADPLMEELEDLLQSPRAFEERGNRALSGGDWVTAAAYFRRGLELAPDDPTLRHRLGTALFQMGDADGAVSEFERILRASPDHALAHFSLAVIMEARGRRAEAIERFEAAVRHQPGYVDARLGLAGLLRRSGRLEESLSQYEQVLQQAPYAPGDPRVAEAPFGQAITLVRLGRYREARDRLAEAMAVYPDQPFFVHALARLLAAAPDGRVRDGDRALALLQALPEDLRRIDLGETMAMALAEVGLYERALTWQRDALTTARRGGRHDLVPGMAEKLSAYENGRPWRSPDPIGFDPFLERSSIGRP